MGYNSKRLRECTEYNKWPQRTDLLRSEFADLKELGALLG